MSRKWINKCDGCGVEVVEGDETPGVPRILTAGRPRGTDAWGHLNTAMGASFDLCESCTKRVVDLLELEIPDLSAIARRYGGYMSGLGGLGGHAMPFMSGDFMMPPSAPPWGKPGSASPPFGGLTPEDLKALGIELPSGLTSAMCPGCGVARPGPIPAGAICGHCGHQNP